MLCSFDTSRYENTLKEKSHTFTGEMYKHILKKPLLVIKNRFGMMKID